MPSPRFQKGNKSTLGMHWKLSEETKRKQSEAQKKRWEGASDLVRKEWGEKHRRFLIGRIPWNKGKKWSDEIKKKMSLAKIGRKLSIEHKRNISLGHGGDGISPNTNKPSYHLRDFKYKEWRNSVFERDNYICQKCFCKSGEGKTVFLHPHHIIGWVKNKELRYVLSNGITLCRGCHKLAHKRY